MNPQTPELKPAQQPQQRQGSEVEKDRKPSIHRLLMVATPIVVFFTVLLVWPYFQGEWPHGEIFVLPAIAVALGMTIATIFPRKGHFGFRFVTFVVGLLFLWYVVTAFMMSGDDLGVFRPSHEPSPFRALMGFLAVGIPCMVYTVYGRSFVKEDDEDEFEDESLFDTMFHAVEKAAKGLYQLLHLIALAVLIWKVLEKVL